MVYHDESDFYNITINGKQITSNDGNGIHISKGQFAQDEFRGGFFANDSGRGFTDYFSLPLEYGTCYTVRQKYYQFRPIPEYGSMNDYSLIKYKNGNVLFKYSPNYEKHYTKLQYLSPNCDSCFNELKNRFPELFE